MKLCKYSGLAISSRVMMTTFTIVAGVLVLLASGVSGLADSNIPPAALSGSTNISVAAVPGQTLTPTEAEQALKRLNRKIPSPGTWRRTTIEFAPDPLDTNDLPGWLASANFTYGWPASTNVIYERRLPDGRRFVRKEITERDLSGKSESKLYVRNEEGSWALLKSVAILYPEVAGKRIGNSSAAPKEPSVEIGVFNRPFDGITGERIKEGERVFLRITQWIREDASREMAREAKKQVPLLFRPLFTTSFIERGMAQIVAFRVETILDEQTGDLIIQRQYRKGGKPLDEEQGWSPVADLPAEAYAVPKSLKQLRPKTRREAQRLEEKTRAQEVKSAKKR